MFVASANSQDECFINCGPRAGTVDANAIAIGASATSAAPTAASSTADSLAEGESETVKTMARDANGNWVETTRTRSGTANTPEPVCSEPAEKAQSLCTLGDAGMNAQLQGAIQNATQMMSSGGTEKACKAASAVQMLAGMANGAHAILCQKAISSCSVACGKEVERLTPKAATDPASDRKLKATTSAIKSCKRLQGNVIASGMSAMNNVMSFAMSQKCQKAVTTNNQPGTTPPPPMDCTNPIMASSLSCVCASNPSDPSCTASNGGLGDGGFSSVGAGSGAVDGGKDPESFGFGDELPQLEASSGGAGAAQGSSGGGGGMNGGGGAGALPPEESGGAGAGPYNTDIMGGLTGGGGGGGGSFGRGGGEGSGGGGLLDSLAEKFNLKGFLPSKADFKNRGLASGMGADGITGPNGPSLFEKVSSRYLKKQSELLP